MEECATSKLDNLQRINLNNNSLRFQQNPEPSTSYKPTKSIRDYNQPERFEDNKFNFNKLNAELHNLSYKNTWVDDFNQSNVAKNKNTWVNEFKISQPKASVNPNKFINHNQLSHSSTNYVNFNQQQQYTQNNYTSNQHNWDRQFDKFDKPILNEEPKSFSQSQTPNDDLARTARNLIDTVEPDKYDKFRNSEFFSFMKQLSTGEYRLENDEFVSNNTTSENNWTKEFDIPNKESAITGSETENPSLINAPEPYNKLLNIFGPSTSLNDYDVKSSLNGDLEQGTGTGAGVKGPQEAEWDTLQQGLDEIDSTFSNDIKRVDNLGLDQPREYAFEANKSKPDYLNHISHIESVLRENSNNAQAWYELGVCQQENENDSQAISALLKAVELDQEYADPWLALAISYTNESEKVKSTTLNNQNITSDELIRCLCEIVVQQAKEDIIDADVQVALGVVFSLSESYEKGIDCFRTALSTKPNDWLLLNRLGATLSNSGQCRSSLEFYYRALDLHPTYVRAMFNLGIALMNLKDYDEAIRQILSALAIQSEGNEQGGTNQINFNMWDTLRNCLLQYPELNAFRMRRSELTQYCNTRDINEKH
ncbi:TPR-like protein [Wallemia mellicola]|nr:TPR-like protein [Wallemia mellicola]TIC59225.1 TPR-like protein [Wallemia mellicola]